MLAELTTVVGLAALVVAVVWRGVTRRRVRQRVEAMLCDPDAQVRLDGAGIVGDIGLARFGTALLERVRIEADPAVLDALGEAVARNQRPLDDPGLIELRVLGEQEDGRSSTPCRVVAAAGAPGRGCRRRFDPSGLGPPGRVRLPAPTHPTGLPMDTPDLREQLSALLGKTSCMSEPAGWTRDRHRHRRWGGRPGWRSSGLSSDWANESWGPTSIRWRWAFAWPM